MTTPDDLIGKTFEVECPFVRTKYQGVDEDGYFDALSWKPGIEWGGDDRYNGDPEAIAHGMGRVLYHVVSVHKLPHPYPSRVFFTRRWVAPDGREFGTTKLRIMTVGSFRTRLRGYVPAGVSRWTKMHVKPLTKDEEAMLLSPASHGEIAA